MSVGVPNFQGARLTQARVSRGLFKNSLGDLVGVSGQAISNYEDGKDNPQADRLERLIQVLNFPREFFFKPVRNEDIGLVHWRSHATESKSAREMTKQRMNWLCEIFEFVESEVEFSFTPLPKFDLPSDFNLISNDRIETLAMEVRQHWGLRSEPIPDMILALENAGIPVVALNISSEKQDGFCFPSPELNRHFVGINISNASASRARLDAAHELGHIILHRNVTRAQANTPVAHKLIEKQAFRFAGALLFPRDAFLREVNCVSLDYLCNLKRRWGMAISAMIVRAHDLGLIEQDEYSNLFRQMTRRRWRGPLREPFDKEMVVERPRMLRRGFEVLLGSGMFAKASVLSELALPAKEVEELAALDAGTLIEDRNEALAVSLRSEPREVMDLESGKVIQFPRRAQ